MNCSIILSIFILVLAQNSFSQVVKLKFWLYDSFDSTLIDPNKISITPKISERAYHNNKREFNKKYIKSSKITYKPNDKSYLFEYFKKYYPYNDIFLSIKSKEYYFIRENLYDYDENECLNLTKNNGLKFYLFPYKYFIVKKGDLNLDSIECLEISLFQINENGDTVRKTPINREFKDTIIQRYSDEVFGELISTITNNSSFIYLNEKITIDYESKHLVRIDILKDKKFYVKFIKLGVKNELYHQINLNQLEFRCFDLDASEYKCTGYNTDARGSNCLNPDKVK